MNTKDIRKMFRLTQKELAEILGIKVKKVQNWDQRNSMDELVHLLTKLELIDILDNYEYDYNRGIVACSFAEYAADAMRSVRDEGIDLPELEEEKRCV